MCIFHLLLLLLLSTPENRPRVADDREKKKRSFYFPPIHSRSALPSKCKVTAGRHSRAEKKLPSKVVKRQRPTASRCSSVQPESSRLPLHLYQSLHRHFFFFQIYSQASSTTKKSFEFQLAKYLTAEKSTCVSL